MKTRRNHISIALLALLASVTVSTAYAETVLISGQSNSGRGTFGDGIKWFHSEVEKRSNGEISIDPQWGGALFKAPAARQSVADGIADMGVLIGAYTPTQYCCTAGGTESGVPRFLFHLCGSVDL